MKRRRPDPNEKILRPVRPNAGLAALYRKRLDALIDEMTNSVVYWLRASYRKNEPRMAMDTPASKLQDAVNEMADRWQTRFDEAAPRLAEWFAQSVEARSRRQLMSILSDAGFTVKFKMTPTMKDILDATIEQNIALIKSIPQQYLTQVQGSVMRSVQSGRDLGTLVAELTKQHGVTARRATLIARTQNNMATAQMTRARQEEVGVTEAIWLHSHGGREPRPTHVANDGKRYNIAEGWFDPDPKVRKNIWPGELINCRCVPKAIVKGFS